MENKDITKTVIEYAYRVYNKMGFGERKVEIKRKMKDLN